MLNIRDFGAIGDGVTKDTPSIQRAIDYCAAKGGGTVLVPAGGRYLIGQIDLKDHVDLQIEGGAVLLASLEEADYRDRVLIYAHSAEDVSVSGAGVIDGRGTQFMGEELPYLYCLDPQRKGFRPFLLRFVQCKNVNLRYITFRDAPAWTVHLVGCEDVLIHGIRIWNNLKVPNCDGIDPDHCRNVRISDCHIVAADDCIVLKCTRWYGDLGPCENITVTGCTLVSKSSALKIGTETRDDIRNVIFDACVVRNSTRGLAIMLRDEGKVENVIFSNITVETSLHYDAFWGKSEPIYVTALHRKPGTPLGRVRNVRFSNILCQGESGAFLQGSEDSVLEDIVLENVRIAVDKVSEWPGGLHDLRPYEGEAVFPHRTAGLFLKHARDVSLRNVKVAWGDHRPDYYGPALEAHGVENLDLQNLQGEAAHPDKSQAIVMD